MCIKYNKIHNNNNNNLTIINYLGSVVDVRLENITGGKFLSTNTCSVILLPLNLLLLFRLFFNLTAIQGIEAPSITIIAVITTIGVIIIIVLLDFE